MFNKPYDVVIVGGSYSGLSAAMALGRALRNVLVIDGGEPCNRQTPHSHNFLTQDGNTPYEISRLGRQQVEKYKTVEFVQGLAVNGKITPEGFEIRTQSGETFYGKKLIFATGIKDMMPDIPGFAECWGISVLHCPYCHGYEVAGRPTAILANGDAAVELSVLISNWTNNLVLVTNGPSGLNTEQQQKITSMGIHIEENAINSLRHERGILKEVVFESGSTTAVQALYSRQPFIQHCEIPRDLGCEITQDGYIKVDGFQRTTVPGIFACGDNVTRMRTVSNAVALGTTAGLALNRELLFGFW